MAIEVGDAILKIKGDSSQLNQTLNQVEQRTQSSMQKMQNRVRMAGVAFTALGAAGLKIADSARKMNAQLGITALSLGVTTKEMRDLALSATNVTFPLEEVTASFDLLARSGETDTEVIKEVATAFDTLGDATGNSASKVTSIMIPAMKTFHLTAEEAANKIDMMTFMTRNSTTTLEDFNTMVGYTSQDMVKAGLTIDDMAAAMMWMADNGIAPGRVMLREWNKAVTQSEKEGIALTEALGMTNVELNKYKGNLDGATGAAKAFADEANKQYGFMDKLKQKFSELSLKLGTYLEPLESVMAGMTALGPLLLMASMKVELLTVAYWKNTAASIAHKVALIAGIVATKAAAVAQWALNAAMSANPIGLIITAIGALVAAAIWMVKNWDKVVKFFESAWEKIKMLFWQGTEKVLGITEKLLGWIPGLGDKIKKLRENFRSMIDAEEIKREAKDAFEFTGSEIEGMTDKIRAELEAQKKAKLSALDDERKVAEEQHADAIKRIKEEYGEAKENIRNKIDLAKDASRAAKNMIDDELDIARKAHDEKISMLQSEYDQKIRTINAETDAVISDLQLQIDALDRLTEQEERTLKEQSRLKKQSELEEAVTAASTVEEKMKADDELSKYLTQVTRERLLESRKDQKDALRDRITAIQLDAKAVKDRLSKELEEKRAHEASLFSEVETRLEREKAELDIALDNELTRIDKEREAAKKAQDDILAATLDRLDVSEAGLIDHYAKQLEETALYIAATNDLTAQLQDRTITVTTVQNVVAPPLVYTPTPSAPAAPTFPEGPPSLQWSPAWQPMATGGIVTRPTPIIAGEAGTEIIAPLDKLGSLIQPRKADIRVYLDESVLVEVLSQRIVDQVRIRQGMIL